MMAGTGDDNAAASRAQLRASRGDRERVIDTLKAAFAQGRLTRDEFDVRVGQTLVSRTYAELAAVSAVIPARLAQASSPSRRVSNAARWGVSGLMTPAILAVAFTLVSLPGDGGYGAVAFVLAFMYFLSWLATGADMLWKWHSMRAEP
jgi:Domain of unknown function (DUF1707)